MSKRLTTSTTNAKIFGVCGGIGEYLGIDPVFIRLFAIIATVMSGFGPGILVYIALAFIMPRPTKRDSYYEPSYTEHTEEENRN